MSKFKYEFGLSIGYNEADVKEELDLVDDLNHEESYLEGLSKWDLKDLVSEELEGWSHQWIETWAERING